METTYIIKDDSGNSLKATHEMDLITLTLFLIDGSKRIIGQINKKSRVLKLIRNREKHLMRVNNSYGINYFLIENGKLFNWIEITDDYASWTISKEYLIENSITMNFKKQGFEVQKFISIEMLDSYKNNKEQIN